MLWIGLPHVPEKLISTVAHMSDDWQPFFDDLISEAANTKAHSLGGAKGLIMGPDGMSAVCFFARVYQSAHL